MKTCPFCAEKIQNEATVCRYCGRDLPGLAPVAVASLPTPVAPSAPVARRHSVWAIGALLALVPFVLAELAVVGDMFSKWSLARLDDLVIWNPVAAVVFYWPYSAFIVWGWRKNRALGIALAIVPWIVFCGIAALVILWNEGDQLLGLT